MTIEASWASAVRRIFLSCLLGLVGCAAERAVLVNGQGEELTCETRGADFLAPYRFAISRQSVSLTPKSEVTG